MPSRNKILFFRQVAIVLSIVWTLVTYLFLLFQLHSEQKHIFERSVFVARDITKQTQYIIEWAFDKQLQESQKQTRLELKTDFSLRDLIYKMNQEKGIELVIEGNYLDTDLARVDKNIAKTLQDMQSSKEERYVLYPKNGETYLYFTKPLLDNGTCSRCHIHDENKKGDILGNVNLEMKVPKFKEYNGFGYTFLLVAYFSTWIIGIFVIWWIRHKNRYFFDEKVKSYEESIYALVDMMEKRDSYTAGHSKRVAYYASLIAAKLDCSKDDVNLIFQAGMLHDIGKVEIPDALLLKPDTLDSSEYELIKTHSKFGYELLCKEPFSHLAKIVLHHHERYDGSGYPYGLSKEEIPYLSQIISVADAFDAMTTNRAYRKSFSIDEALERIQKESGKQFNPKIVLVAMDVLKDVILPEDTTQMPKNILEEMKFSYYFKDQLTDAYNSNYLKFIFAHKHDYENICIYHFHCVNFTAYNRKHGWKQGDKLLQAIAKNFMQRYEKALVVRVFGDNFLLIHLSLHVELDATICKELCVEHDIKISYGHFDLKDEKIETIEDLENKILGAKSQYLLNL